MNVSECLLIAGAGASWKSASMIFIILNKILGTMGFCVEEPGVH